MCERKFYECPECAHYCQEGGVCDECESGEFYEENDDLDFEDKVA